MQRGEGAERMHQCTLLMEFHEKYPEFIEIVESLRKKVVQKGTFSTVDFGGASGAYSTRVIVTQEYTALKITHNDFAVVYYAMHSTKPSSYTKLYGNDFACEVSFGASENKNSVIIYDTNFSRELNIPVIEEEYFQYLTLGQLSPEEVYEYFVDIDIGHQSILQITVQNDGYDKFAELLDNKNIMKNLKKDIELVIFAYKRTNGL